MSFPAPAIGLIETSSIARGMVVCDAMVKKAPVRVLVSRAVTPGKYVILVCGGVDEVDEAMVAGLELARPVLVDELFLPNAHPQLAWAIPGQRRKGPVDAVGIIETYSVAAAVRAADACVKAAEVSLLSMRLAEHIGGKAFFVFTGELHMAEAGLEAAVHGVGDGLLASSELIARPHEDFVAAVIAR